MLKNLDASALGPKRMVQMLLGVAVLTLALGVVVFFLMNAQIHDMQATVNSKESLVGSNEQIAHRYEKTQQDYDAVAARTEYLEASVSAKSFVPTLLKQLQALATTTHLTVTAVRPGLISSPVPPTNSNPAAGGEASAGGADVKKAPPPPYDTLDIEVDVTGTYADTASFLYNLTRFPKIISVANVQMHPGGINNAQGAASASPVLTTNLHLTAFVFHDASGAGAPAAAPVYATAVAVAPAPTAVPSVTTAAVNPGPATVPTAPVVTGPGSAATGNMTDAAAHAAGRAIGAGKAAQARSEVGIETL